MKFIHTGISTGACARMQISPGRKNAQAIKDTFRKIIEKQKNWMWTACSSPETCSTGSLS